MQTRALREYATRRGWTIALQVKEIGSGASQRERREQLLEAARRREIDVVLVWRLDRWGRSVTDLLATLQELEHLGVGFVSLTEALDLTTPAGRAMAALLAVFAAQAAIRPLRPPTSPMDLPAGRSQLCGYQRGRATVPPCECPVWPGVW
jgi:DNA invertase Pin-like site-specific DNA recombinase